MSRLSSCTACALALLCMAFPASASAAPVAASTRAQASASLIYPLTVTKKTDMDFGYLTATTAGTAVLNPNDNSLRTTGGVVSLGGAPTSAVFLGAAVSSAVVNIKVPNRGIDIVRVGGTEKMRVDDFTLQGQSKRTIAKQTSFEFRVGATLFVNANQAEGFYTGTFDVTVQYP